MPTHTPRFGDMRIAACLVRPHRVELHIYDYMPTPRGGGWIWAGEFDDVAGATTAARENDPDAHLSIDLDPNLDS